MLIHETTHEKLAFSQNVGTSTQFGAFIFWMLLLGVCSFSFRKREASDHKKENVIIIVSFCTSPRLFFLFGCINCVFVPCFSMSLFVPQVKKRLPQCHNPPNLSLFSSKPPDQSVRIWLHLQTHTRFYSGIHVQFVNQSSTKYDARCTKLIFWKGDIRHTKYENAIITWFCILIIFRICIQKMESYCIYLGRTYACGCNKRKTLWLWMVVARVSGRDSAMPTWVNVRSPANADWIKQMRDWISVLWRPRFLCGWIPPIFQ